MTDFLAQWVELTTRAPKRALGALLLLTLLLGWVGISNFRVNSNLSDLIAQNALGARTSITLKSSSLTSFAMVVVVSGESLKRVEIATRAVLVYLRGPPELTGRLLLRAASPSFAITLSCIWTRLRSTT